MLLLCRSLWVTPYFLTSSRSYYVALEWDDLVDGHEPHARQVVVERLALDEVHLYGGAVVDEPRLVDAHDVRVPAVAQPEQYGALLEERLVGLVVLVGDQFL